MNYLMREQDEQEEERFRKLDEAIRELHGKSDLFAVDILNQGCYLVANPEYLLRSFL